MDVSRGEAAVVLSILYVAVLGNFTSCKVGVLKWHGTFDWQFERFLVIAHVDGAGG